MDLVKVWIEKLVYPMMERKNGNRIRAYIREMRSSQSLAPEALRALQEERLKKLLLTCADSVPAYAGLSTSDIEADVWGTFAKIVPLTKKQFQTTGDTYLNTKFPANERIANKTGGSTGEPTQFFMNRYNVEHYEAARWRGLSWWGITPGSRSILVWGSPLELDAAKQKSYRRKEKWLKNRQFIPAYELHADRAAEYAKMIDQYHPEYLYGYSSSLDTLARIFETANVKPKLRLKAILSTSETLHDHQKERIERVFGCSVINEYGARDAGILAYACPAGQLHITAENAIVELLDAKTLQPVAPGESGLVVVTDLNNLTQPRLRYILGDMATASTEPQCTCGVTLPMLARVDGREDDMLVRVDGTLVHGHAISHLTRKRRTIAKFKLVQSDRAHAELLVMQTKPDMADLDAFVADVREMLAGVEVSYQKVDEIPPEKSGKTRYAIRKFTL